MATIFTHALVGAALAPLAPADVSRRRAAVALAVLAVVPDLDVIGFWLGIPYGHPLGHRGFSHSLLFAVLVSAVVARFGFATARPWRLFFALAVATASHGMLDALTDGGRGVGFAIPFSDARFFAPVRPIPVSPIGPHASVVGVLRFEILYVWLPVLALLAAGAIWSAASSRATAPHDRRT